MKFKEEIGMKNKQTMSLICALIGYSIFGLSFLVTKQALQGIDIYVMLAIRFSVVFIVMTLLIFLKIFKVNYKNKDMKILFLIALFQPIIYFTFETNGIALVDTSFAGTIMALAPVVTLFLGFIFLKEKVTILQIIFSAVSVVGVYITTIDQGGGESSLIGLLYMLGAVTASAAYAVFSRKASGIFSAIERTYIMFFVGAVFFSSLAFLRIDGDYYNMLLVPMMNIDFWIAILYLSILSSIVAFSLINYALSNLKAAQITIFANFVTVISILAGVLILKEPFGIYKAVGSGVIIISVYMVSRQKAE